MSKAKLYGMPRKGIPNKRCFDKHWKQERTLKNGTKQDKYSANGPGRYPRKG